MDKQPHNRLLSNAVHNGTRFSSLCSIYLTWDLSLVGLYHMKWKPGPRELKFPVFKIERIDVEFWSAENGFINVGNYSVFGKTRKTQPVVLWNCVLRDKLIILCDNLAQTFINLYFCFQIPHTSHLYKKIKDFKRRLHWPSLWSTVAEMFPKFWSISSP